MGSAPQPPFQQPGLLGGRPYRKFAVLLIAVAVLAYLPFLASHRSEPVTKASLGSQLPGADQLQAYASSLAGSADRLKQAQALEDLKKQQAAAE
jgi:hypothetical protein